MKRHTSKNKGVAVMLVCVLLLVIVPMIGLAIDGGIVYFLKGQLQQAVDASALAGARSLSSGLTIQAQITSATNTANQYFKANFPDSFWATSVTTFNAAITEDPNNSHTRYVTVNSTVASPLYFLRLIGMTTANIGASAQAKRRDVNVMLVLDRSGSMGTAGAMTPMIQAAISFVNQFAPGRDKIGLVSFGGTYYNVPPTTNFQPSIVNTLNSLTSYGSTGTAQALWVAYQDLATIPNGLGQPTGEPGALNAILFFTDGEPNDITADFHPYLSNPSGCGNGGPMVGFFSSYFYADGSLAGTGGIFTPTTSGPSDPGDSTQAEIIGNNHGCNFAANLFNAYLDVTQIPPTDYYGNSTNPANPYKTVNLQGLASNSTQDLINASFNAADQAAQRMRAGTLNNIVPVIYSISLLDSVAAPADPIFMKRVANTTDSPIYNSNKPTGLYIDTQHSSELQNAFLQIAAQILHLSQ
jgi:Flp pilus assembly protein TadG